MDILDFFDIYDPEHLAAWRYFEVYNSLPFNFLPDDVQQSGNWDKVIRIRMQDAWIKAVFGGVNPKELTPYYGPINGGFRTECMLLVPDLK